MRLPKFMQLASYAAPVLSPLNTFFFGGGVHDGYDEASNKPVTEAQAMRVPAYAACVRLLSDSLAYMPLRLMRKRDCGAEEVTDHPALKALQDPDPKRPALTGQDVIRLTVQNMLIHGNGYIEQIRVNGGSKVFALKPISPTRVEVCVDDDERIVYRISAPVIGGKQTTTQRELKSPDILHFKSHYTDCEGWQGIGTLVTLRDLLRASLEQLYHAKASLVGGNVKGFLSFPTGNISQEQIKAAQATLNDPKVDMKWKAMPGDPKVIYPPGNNQMHQFVESRRAQIAEYARAFGIPGFLLSDTVGASNWGSGLTEQSASYVRFTLQPLAQSIEGVLDQCILTDRERMDGLYYEFDFKSFMRGTPNQRADYYAKGVSSGWLSPADARAMEGLEEDDGCDSAFKPAAQVQAPTGAPPAGERPPNTPAGQEE